MSVTDTQILTLRRMRSGTKYQLRGDRQSGREVRRDIATRQRCDVNCRSLAPLLRTGLIDFAVPPTDKTRYYDVKMTAAGLKIAKFSKTQQEAIRDDLG